MKSHVRPLIGSMILMLTAIAASASTPTPNRLGFTYQVAASGSKTEITIHLRPSRDFDAVELEAASGVASLDAPCAFQKLEANTARDCTLHIMGKPSAAAMSVNLVARYMSAGAAFPHTEIHRLSIKNPGFIAAVRTRLRSQHVLPQSATATSR